MSTTLSGLSAAEEEQLRNVRAFMFERFNRVGMTDAIIGPVSERPERDVVAARDLEMIASHNADASADLVELAYDRNDGDIVNAITDLTNRYNREQLERELAQRPRGPIPSPRQLERHVHIERLESLAVAVRAQLLNQVRGADLQRDVVLRAHMETVPISQDERQRDLLLIQSQAYVNVELAAISYLEHEGDVVNAIMALNEGTEQRAQLEEGLRQRQALLGLRVTEDVDAIPLADLSEERREVIREARRAFQRAAALASRTDSTADGHPQAWRNGAIHQAPLPQRMHVRPSAEHHLLVRNHGPIGLGKTDRGARHRVIQREAIRSEMEALEEQVEACAIDENTYNEKAMALKDKFEAVSSGQDDETSRPRFFMRSPNWYEARDDAEEEVDWAVRPEEVD